MLQWKSILCTVALVMATSSAHILRDNSAPVIKIPDGCKGQHLCTIKPEGYDQLEAKINSWVPDYLLKDPVDGKEMVLQEREGKVENETHNCLEEKESGRVYVYFYNDSDPRNPEILAQSDRFIQKLETVKCRKLPEPLTPDSKEQCFGHLGVTQYSLKSSCETIYARHSLYVINKSKTGIIKKILRVPVACSCKVSEYSRTLY